MTDEHAHAHAPTPYTVTVGDERNPYNGCIRAADGTLLMLRAVMSDRDRAQLEFMALACNTHDAAREALSEGLEHIEWIRRHKNLGAAGPNDVTHRMRATLAAMSGTARAPAGFDVRPHTPMLVSRRTAPCCANERRNINGGCDSCGDPSL